MHFSVNNEPLQSRTHIPPSWSRSSHHDTFSLDPMILFSHERLTLVLSLQISSQISGIGQRERGNEEKRPNLRLIERSLFFTMDVESSLLAELGPNVLEKDKDGTEQLS